MMPPSKPRVDELVKSIQRSNLFNVVVEGKDDAAFYRKIEEELDTDKLSFLPCGGRDILFAVLDRRQEFSHQHCLFIADRDMYTFTGIPPMYICNELVFTQGYSVENDIISSTNWKRILGPKKARILESCLPPLIDWFARESTRFRTTGSANVDVHIEYLMPTPGGILNASVIANQPSHADPIAREKLLGSFFRHFRGKTAVQLIRKLLKEEAKSNISDRDFVNFLMRVSEIGDAAHLIDAVRKHFSLPLPS